MKLCWSAGIFRLQFFVLTALLCKEKSEHFFFFFFFFHLTYSRWTSSSLPSCLWSQRIFPSLPGSRLTIFLSRCKFSTLTTRQLMVEFYLLTFPRFPLRKKEHKSYFGKNRTHDFRTSRCAAYLLDHSGDEHLNLQTFQLVFIFSLPLRSDRGRFSRLLFFFLSFSSFVCVFWM